MLTDLNPFDMAKERSEKCSICCPRQTKCHVRWSGILSLVSASHTHSSHTELEFISSMLEAVRNDALQHASGLAERTEETETAGQATGLCHTVQPLPSVVTVMYFFYAYPRPTDTHVLEGMGKSYGSFLSSMFYAQLQNPKVLKERNNTQL